MSFSSRCKTTKMGRINFLLVVLLLFVHAVTVNGGAGTALKSTRVAGARVAQKGEVPYIVAISQDGRSPPLVCGGTIIDKKYIVTAAHCFNYVSATAPLWVTAGALDLNKPAGTEQKVRVEMYAQHPDFDRAQHRNDIAIIKLKTDLIFNDRVQPLPLPPPDLPTSGGLVSMLATLSGWGSTKLRKMDSPRAPHSDTLQTISMLIYPRPECDRIFDETAAKDIRENTTSKRLGVKHGSDTVFCAGLHPLTGTGFCGGDDGSPLMCAREEKPNGPVKYLCGVASTAAGCGLPIPDLYTDVARFTNWIKGVTGTKWVPIPTPSAPGVGAGADPCA